MTSALRTLLLCSLTAAWAMPTSALAGGTRTLKVSDYASLDRGETQGAAIESDGTVTVGYLPQRGEVKQTTAFSCVADGKSVLIGTADEASILRVYPNLSKKAGKKTKPSKRGKKGQTVTPEATLKVEQVASLDGVLVSAMVNVGGGSVIAATVPGGKLVKVSKKGKVSDFATLPVEQIWGLLVHKGKLYAATGPKGELYSMSLDGKSPKVVFDAKEKDILSILPVGDDLLVGVSPQANLYRVTDDVEGELLHSFSGDEVRALAVVGTKLVVAINTFEDRKLGSLDALSKTLQRTSLTGTPPSGSAGNERPPSAHGELHAVDLGSKLDVSRSTEAPWEQWLDRSDQYFTSLLSQGESVMVGTSHSGKVYRVSGPRSAATVADFDERQTTALCQLPKGPAFAATAHGAAVYQLRAASASQAKYRPKVHDAIHPSKWGAVLLRGSGKISLRARVGPTDKPDDRWSDWVDITLSSGKDGRRGSLAKLAKRRYVEFEVGLNTADSTLRSLEAFYAPENLAPLLTQVSIGEPKFKKSDSSEPSTSVKIKWKVDSRDDDDLLYDVRIRPEGGSSGEWIAVTKNGEPVTGLEVSLDLATVPDGVYEVGVRASDEPANGSAAARTDELVSDPFVVDRQRPSVSTPAVTGERVTATATDEGGYIHDASYSVDGGRFRTASAQDGVFDSPKEVVEFDLPDDLRPGAHRVVLRVRDASGNLATIPVVIRK
ncbi:MAG: hypothetical protein ACRBN8_34600 [Nannocystales bacterium]